MEDSARAIVELANLIKNPKELFYAAEELGKRFKLSDEEIEKRNQYNDLVAKGNALQKDIAAAQKANEFRAAQLEAESLSLDEERQVFETDMEEKQKALDSVGASLSAKEKDISKRDNELTIIKSQLDAREQGIVAKENELRIREEEVSLREDKMRKVVAAMG